MKKSAISALLALCLMFTLAGAIAESDAEVAFEPVAETIAEPLPEAVAEPIEAPADEPTPETVPEVQALPLAPVADTAENPVILRAPLSYCIRSFALSCTPKSGGVITAGLTVNCNEMATKLGVSSIAIQENRNGSWVTVASSSNVYVYNAYNFSTSIQYTGTPGKQYQSIATIVCLYDGAYEYRYPSMGPETAIK